MSQIGATPCDRGVVAATEPAVTPVSGRLVLAGTVLGSSLAFIDGSAVNLTLPVIQRQLGGDAAGAQWIMNAYALMLGALVLAGGAAADRYGRRRVFVVGVVLFSAASALCGAAPNLTLLIMARALQGVGAALLVPASLALLGASFDEEARGRAVGVWAGASGLMSAIGPVLGGWLTDVVSWRAVFLINLPLAALAVGFILSGARESREPAAGPVDWSGAVCATLGLSALTWSLTQASTAGGSPAVWGLGAAGAFLLAAFVHIERRATSPMVPLDLFRSPAFSGANLLTLLLYAAFGGALFLLPFQLIRVHGYPATEAGAALLPLSIGLAALSPISGVLSGRIGVRAMLTIGPLLAAAGFAGLAWSARDGAYWTGVFPGLAVLALGMGVAVAPLTDAVLGAVPNAYEGAASGVNNATARIGGLLAVALAGFVLAPGEAGGESMTQAYQAAMIAAACAAAAAGLVGAFAMRPQPSAGR
ncbi:DHA2 family efflux MFS transporter permease subunit [Phenylobacterium sp. 58.2.17]|uniref:DHA2 family efflux MFS transporter permease subunit n=1 Tax=Phenylobacterium sp. 58.2.17 TaxID=2969306 RepID=UPI002263F09E|nr:DHA2 family efflux MFS transporter permease subunit [Phenylobacterium sp. 58.2.17]MCX7587893.1 DHA2 family efflux MFS transporter permease subunit [Phenylobacterium sp. 58.2.17]